MPQISDEQIGIGINERSRVVEPLLRCLLSKRKICEDTLLTILGTTLRKVSDCIHTQAIMLVRLQQDQQRVRFSNIYFSPSLYRYDKELRKRYLDRVEQLKNSTILLATDSETHQVIQSEDTIPFRAFVREEVPDDPVILAPGLHVGSVVAVPLRNETQRLGCIVCVNKCPEFDEIVEFTVEDGLLLVDVAEYTTHVLHRLMNADFSLDPVYRAKCTARLARSDFVRLRRGFPMDEQFIRKIGSERIRTYGILPLEVISERKMRAAMVDPLNQQSVGEFEVATGYSVAENVVVTSDDIDATLERIFNKSVAVKEALESVSAEYGIHSLTEDIDFNEEEVNENSAPIVRLTNRIVEDAHTQGASDIHVEPQEINVVVRYRVDGVCHVKHVLPEKVHRPVITRLKIMSELDIAERRLPQDGRIPFRKYNSSYDIDLRVSVVPTKHGESIVMRILDKSKPAMPLDNLGFSDFNLERYRADIRTPYGMILHCGPTGSGKSMTLYSALNEINKPDVKIITAEDPIEYTLPGLVQVQIKHSIGLTFAAALRCFLRQDPDVILVGEIRDAETAQIAVEAALTGHLLFSTLHTNDAASAVTRLNEIGIEPFLIANSVISVCSQRLVRKLCGCAQLGRLTEEQHEILAHTGIAEADARIRIPKGCEDCDKTGYRGRTGIHELLQIDNTIRDLIVRGEPSGPLKIAARANGMRTLFQDAMLKVRDGMTSFEEAIRVVQPDESAIG